MTRPTPTAALSAPEATDIPGSPGKALRNWSSLIGIITAIVGNILIALALNVQRYAHTRLNKERVRVRQRARAALKRSQSGGSQSGSYGAISGDANGQGYGDEETRPLAASHGSSMNTDPDDGDDGEQAKVASTYLKSPYWWLGQILITLGEMGNFLAYGFAPASIVSPLGVVALVSNCIIAPAMFHEKFRGRDFWGVVIAVAGVVTVVLSANQEETKLGPHDVWEAITTTEFEIYLGFTTFLILVLMWASGRYGKRTILIDLGLVGLFGGYTALATKGVSSMLSSTLWRAFTTPVTYVLVFILLATAVMQIRYVNKALQRFDSTQVIPIQFVLFTLCVILGSAILYRDFEKTTAEQGVKFVGGCLLTFFGVFLITTGRQPQEDVEDLLSDEEGVEETIGLTQQETHAPGRGQEALTPPSQSRRSSRLSRVSFADTTKPGSPPDDADVPSLGPLGAAESLSDLRQGESLPLLGNPWQESHVDSAQPPRGARTLSTDSAMTVPALASTSVNSVPPSPVKGVTHPQIDRPVTPRTSSAASRASSHRRSKTFISPSPLSSTVTTVVKDAFLRGHDVAEGKKTSLKRIRSSIRASLFFHDEDDKGLPGHDQVVAALVPEDQAPIVSRAVAAVNSDEEEPRRRMSRSVSDALGDFFRSRKRKPGGMGDGHGDATSDAETGMR